MTTNFTRRFFDPNATGHGCNNAHNLDIDASCDGEPKVPCMDDPECKDYLKAKCVFWTGDDVPALGIKKGMNLVQVIYEIAARI